MSCENEQRENSWEEESRFLAEEGKRERNEEATAIIQETETQYPMMYREFLAIQKEQLETFCRKSMSYGTSNISMGTTLTTPDDVKLSLMALWVRMNDKINRLKQLIMLNTRDVVGEPAADAFMDLSVYGIIAQIVTRGKWGK